MNLNSFIECIKEKRDEPLSEDWIAFLANEPGFAINESLTMNMPKKKIEIKELDSTCKFGYKFILHELIKYLII